MNLLKKLYKKIRKILGKVYRKTAKLLGITPLRDRVRALEKTVEAQQKQIDALQQKQKKSTPKKERKEPKMTKEVSRLVDIINTKKAEKRERLIMHTAKALGREREFAMSMMEKARRQMGISYGEFVANEFYNLSFAERKEKAEEIKAEAKRKKKEEFAEKKAGYLSIIKDATGWDDEYAEFKVKQAAKATGVSWEHYTIYRYFELTPEEQKTYFSKGEAEKLFAIYNNNSPILRAFYDKEMFCTAFEKYLGRPWMSTTNMGYKEFARKFGNLEKVIYKPLALSGGHGIKVFSLESGVEEVYKQLCEMPEGIVEGYLKQHPLMQQLSLNSVNTIRVVTAQTYDDIPGVEKGKVHFLYGGVRMGHGDSYVDNLHSGGMIGCIDMETGIIETDGVDFANRVYEKHPDTNVQIKGFQIPYFKEVKELLQEAGKGLPGYFGWDVAITETGPVLIEANTRPGADALQTPYIPQRQGKRYVIEKYLGE